jgi:mRNA-degrading endonuclease RelE of RelBE toxin-antitoxin system
VRARLAVEARELGHERSTVRVAARWPDVSGVKWLRGTWAGTGRLRAGDWRVLFRLVSQTVIVVRIQHRSQVYEE